MAKGKGIAVIGANYGDEGKGATVHHLCKTHNSRTVVRFNGGNQAGHTVRLADGIRHVFSNYGSGTLYGAQTYIADSALFNPLSALKEKEALIKLQETPPTLIVAPATQVITPFDIAINQFLEHGRGDGKHGSCGMGIGETMKRVLTGGPILMAKDLTDTNSLFEFVIEIRDWFKNRIYNEARDGSFTYLNEEQKASLYELINYRSILQSEMYKYMAAVSSVRFATLKEIVRDTDTVIFEGAQGLLLDQNDREHFPYVTYSNTGITNVVRECIRSDIELTEVYYVTRPYLTRHGQGPILAGTPCENRWGQDLTNQPNEYQGSLRYAEMDWWKFANRVKRDMLDCKVYTPKLKIMLTCPDQIDQAERSKITSILKCFGLEVEILNGLNG